LLGFPGTFRLNATVPRSPPHFTQLEHRLVSRISSNLLIPDVQCRLCAVGIQVVKTPVRRRAPALTPNDSSIRWVLGQNRRWDVLSVPFVLGVCLLP